MTFSEEVQRHTQELTQEFKVFALGGFDLSELLEFMFNCLKRLIAVARSYTNISPAAKKRQILRAIRIVYKSVNPNIPFLFEPVESFVESVVLDSVLPQVYDLLDGKD